MKNLLKFENFKSQSEKLNQSQEDILNVIDGEFERIIESKSYRGAREFTIAIQEVIEKYMDRTTLGWEVKSELQKESVDSDTSLDDLYQNVIDWEDSVSGTFEEYSSLILKLVKNWEKLSERQQSGLKFMIDQGDLDDIDDILEVLQEKGIEVRS